MRYQRSVLGFGWALINPLAMILIYMVVFSQIMAEKLPEAGGRLSYGIYLCTGILTWSFFNDLVIRNQTAFLDNANLLKKISFPRASLPAIAVLTAAANFILGFGLFLITLLISGNFPGVRVVAIVPVLMIMVALATGLGVALGVLNVFFRDVGQASTSILQVWFWLTPIVYPINSLPAAVAEWVRANPISPLIEALHAVFSQKSWPDWASLIYPAVVAVILCLLGLYGFRRRVAEMVDEL